MAYSEALAERVRDELQPRVEFVEKKMFGGLAFMVNTHMACGILGDGLMVRVGKAGHEAAIARGAREMDFTGRPMRGMVMIDGEGLNDQRLMSWIAEAVAFALADPPKPRKPSRTSGSSGSRRPSR
jgi:TfoX/Sxy family transcriptional regulator of competence genes